MRAHPRHVIASIFSLILLGCGSVACATGLPKDVVPGSAGSFDENAGFWLPFGDAVVFWGKGNIGIWRTDGTTVGTTMIQPFIGPLSSVSGFGSYYGIAGDKAVFFIADDGFYGAELWRTDGTNGGALRLTDLGPGAQPANITYWITASGMFYFQVGTTLYKTDGTTPASVTVVSGADESSATVVDVYGKLIFSCGMNFLRGPCVRDSAGTVTLLKQINNSGPYVPVNEKVYFVATTAAEGKELWVTDSTPAGTQIVADLTTGVPDSNPTYLTRMDDKLYFIARDMTHGYELWSTDGTGPGTARITDLNPSGDGAQVIYAAIDGFLYFRGYDTVSASYALFRSNGTVGNASLVKNVAPQSAGAMNGRLMINNGQKPWVSDGTALGTYSLDSTVTLTPGYNLLAANGKMIFPGTLQSVVTGIEPLEMNLERITKHKWCSRPEKTIPDVSVLTDTFKLPAWGTIQDLTVDVDIGHTYVNDLTVQLVAPDATTVNLINRPTTIGGANCSGDLVTVRYSDSAIFPICSNGRYAYAAHAQYKPPQPLSAFAGKSTKGQWALKVTDAAAGDIGVLHEWCVDFTTDRIFFHDLED